MALKLFYRLQRSLVVNLGYIEEVEGASSKMAPEKVEELVAQEDKMDILECITAFFL
jgi:DNA-binding LytR/AlgR family response regulator